MPLGHDAMIPWSRRPARKRYSHHPPARPAAGTPGGRKFWGVTTGRGRAVGWRRGRGNRGQRGKGRGCSGTRPGQRRRGRREADTACAAGGQPAKVPIRQYLVRYALTWIDTPTPNHRYANTQRGLKYPAFAQGSHGGSSLVADCRFSALWQTSQLVDGGLSAVVTTLVFALSFH